MPVHDWKRVTAGTFHDFHNAWITELRNSLNGGLLPEGYYALGQQFSGDVGPDLLTLHAPDEAPEQANWTGVDDGGGIAVAEHPPQVSLVFEADREAAFYAARSRTLRIYHVSGDRIVALLEIVSPGNKHNRASVEAFVDKALAAIRDGYHLLVVDLFPPGRSNPRGMHGAIWEAITAGEYEAPADAPLTLASYCVDLAVRSYVEPMAVGRPLPDMPLFLSRARYIEVPLEATYLAAWRGVPERWKRVIEGR